MLASLALVLLIACANMANLFLARTTQRQKEMALRAALGAEQRDVLRLMLKQGVVLTLSGIGMGLATSLVLTRFVASLLFEVRPMDPATLAAVSFVLFVVALLASYIPARRATKVDPIVALRSE